jgi:hypothetical protein
MVNAIGLIVALNFCVAESGPPCAAEESVTFTVKSVVAAAVGVPEIVPEPLKERPAGNDEPEAKLQVSVPAPPLACKVALYAVPTVPLASEVVVMPGAGVMTTAEVTDFVVSLTEVAITVTVIFAETVVGAL